MSDQNRFGALNKTLNRLGVALGSGANILDLGCRGDRAIDDARREGFNGFGCDFSLPDCESAAELIKEGRIRVISTDPYRIPFSDGFFDLVFSNQVLEHVIDYESTLSEISRVLKPEGRSFHVFPSRYSLIEPHIGIPLAGLFQHQDWLRIWTALGLRGSFGRELSATAAADKYREYLLGRTNYLTKEELITAFQLHFSKTLFCLRAYLRHYPSGAAKFAYWAAAIPGIEWLLESFSTRAVLLIK